MCDESARNGCAAGTANDAAVPDSSNAYLWRCDGLHGGANSEKCLKFIPVDGACDDSIRNGCAAGTANDAAIPDSSNAYLWRCDGLHGGANSERCSKSIPVDGACDESVRNGCSAGTANDAAVADTASHYQWRCDGSNGGSNSGVCSAEKPVAQVTCGTAPWSPATTTVCTGQSFTQTRTCNAGCNTGDCATSRSASGTKSCALWCFMVSRNLFALLGSVIHANENLQRRLQHWRLLHKSKRPRYRIVRLCRLRRRLVGMVPRNLNAVMRHFLHSDEDQNLQRWLQHRRLQREPDKASDRDASAKLQVGLGSMGPLERLQRTLRRRHAKQNQNERHY